MLGPVRRVRFSVALVAPVALLALLAAGCRGKLYGTAPLSGPGTAEVTFTSTGAPVYLWADTDGSWEGAASRHSYFPVHYEVEVLSQGKPIGHVSCSTEGASEQVCGSRTSVNGSHKGDCEIKLPCALPSIPAGPATLRVTGAPGKEATDVRKMSVNVRDK